MTPLRVSVSGEETLWADVNHVGTDSEDTRLCDCSEQANMVRQTSTVVPNDIQAEPLLTIMVC